MIQPIKNKKLSVQPYDFVTTFSNLSQKIEYDKIHHNNVKKYYLNARVAVISRTIDFSIQSLYFNIQRMNLRRLLVLVVVDGDEEIPSDILVGKGQDEGDLFVKVQYFTLKDLFEKLSKKEDYEEFSEVFLKLFGAEAAFSFYVFKNIS